MLRVGGGERYQSSLPLHQSKDEIAGLNRTPVFRYGHTYGTGDLPIRKNDHQNLRINSGMHKLMAFIPWHLPADNTKARRTPPRPHSRRCAHRSEEQTTELKYLQIKPSPGFT